MQIKEEINHGACYKVNMRVSLGVVIGMLYYDIQVSRVQNTDIVSLHIKIKLYTSDPSQTP